MLDSSNTGWFFDIKNWLWGLLQVPGIKYCPPLKRVGVATVYTLECKSTWHMSAPDRTTRLRIYNFQGCYFYTKTAKLCEPVVSL